MLKSHFAPRHRLIIPLIKASDSEIVGVFYRRVKARNFMKHFGEKKKALRNIWQRLGHFAGFFFKKMDK